MFGGALAFVAPQQRSALPWRVLEALAVGVPVVATASAAHAEVIVDGGMLVDPSADSISEALSMALDSTASLERLGVLAADRGRAFSWRESADRVWQLHADL